jgi:thiamine-phosphate pyrophosphorylase
MIVHLVTDRQRLTGDAARQDPDAVRACLLRQARYAVDAGVDYVQVRERNLEAADLADLVGELVACAHDTRTRVIVNDRVDVALTAGAAGVHLRGDSMPVAAVRRLAPAPFIVGRSVHTPAEAAAAADADYLVAGSVWPTPSKPASHAVLGIEGFASIARATRVPVLAIGGITVDRACEVAAAGGAGVAAIGLFMSGGLMDGPAGRGAPCRAMPLRDIVNAIRQQFDTSGSRS